MRRFSSFFGHGRNSSVPIAVIAASQALCSGFPARGARSFPPSIRHSGCLRLLRAPPIDDRRRQLARTTPSLSW